MILHQENKQHFHYSPLDTTFLTTQKTVVDKRTIVPYSVGYGTRRQTSRQITGLLR